MFNSKILFSEKTEFDFSTLKSPTKKKEYVEHISKNANNVKKKFI